MPQDERSHGRALVSAVAGVIFMTVAGAAMATMVYYFSDALTGWPNTSKLRVGIVAIVLALASYWTYVGLKWVAEDLAELLERWRLRSSLKRPLS